MRLVAAGGCACKLPAAELRAILGPPTLVRDRRVLVGNESFDDAACYLFSDDSAIVQTLDFFTPIVDDPFTFGRIAATNAVSDVYAMGGTPLFALAIAGFPAALAREAVTDVLRGGQAVAAEAGFPILGGHTIVSPEPLYGLAVTGRVDPDRVWRNGGARAGDVLVLTKRLGTGVVANAMRAGYATSDAVDAATASMTMLNRDAAEALRARGPHAVTDVTGFGLVGHVRELAAASDVHVLLDAAALPLLPHALDLARSGHVPGGSRRNRQAADEYATFAPGVEPALAALACDAQTSGGLLAALPSDVASGLGWQIGRVSMGEPGHVSVI